MSIRLIRPGLAEYPHIFEAGLALTELHGFFWGFLGFANQKKKKVNYKFVTCFEKMNL